MRVPTHLSCGKYNEHDNATHITGGDMSGPGHIHVIIEGPNSEVFAKHLVDLYNWHHKYEEEKSLIVAN